MRQKNHQRVQYVQYLHSSRDMFSVVKYSMKISGFVFNSLFSSRVSVLRINKIHNFISE